MATYQTVFNANIEATNYILNSVSENGSWGTLDYADWGPVITVLNIEHLLHCGISVDEEWSVLNGSGTYNCSINKCLKFLSQEIKDDGSFGADFWDTCKLATLIVEQNLYDYFDYEKLNSYIIQFVKNGKLEIDVNDYSQSAEWSGPGTYAACVYYLYCINEKELANSVLSSAISLQQSDGSFVGKKTQTGDNFVHPIWHTAQMLKVILKSSYNYNAEMLHKIAHWIEEVQGPDGEYGSLGQFVTYYTSYAALAFLALPNRPQPYTDRAIDYLLRKSKNGKYDDFGGTIMAVQVFDAYLNANDLSTVYQDIQIKQSKKLLKENASLKQEVEDLSQKLKEYDNKYKDADIILSKKDVWKIGLWFGIVTLILGIIVPVLINVLVAFLSSPSSSETITATIYNGYKMLKYIIFNL